MSGPLGSSQWMYKSGEAFTIPYSCRFNQPDDATLSKTFASAGNRRTWTFSCWVKIGNLDAEGGGGQLGIFGAYTGGSDTANIQVDGSSGEFHFEHYYSSYVGGLQVTEAKLRDMSAWYHLMVAYDTTQETEANRIKLYVNGTQMTTKTGGNHSYPAENYEGKFNTAIEHKIGMVNGTYCWDGYLAEMHFIDGTALTPTSFGETGDYGEWKPIEVEDLTYGTNGFYLSFAGGGVMSATGGTITTDGDYKVHSFTADGTFTPTLAGEVEYLVIAGGGGGTGAGGGAGGYRTGYLAVQEQAYSITVGDGGAAAAAAYTGGDGENSVFSSITSTGGGGSPGGDPAPGRAGGSGSGGGGGNDGVVGGGQNNPGGAASPAGQGNAGGAGYTDANTYGIGGGGGGAGAAGTNASAGGPAGSGGNGLASSITGSSVTRAGGGGGGGSSGGSAAAGSGGSGGGGAGNVTSTATAGTANTGGGGGGSDGTGGAGGSGIVILRYKFQ